MKKICKFSKSNNYYLKSETLNKINMETYEKIFFKIIKKDLCKYRNNSKFLQN